MKVWDEQAPGPARGIERRLTRLDVRAKEVDLGPVEVELGPPARDEAVVPGLRRRVRHAEAPE